MSTFAEPDLIAAFTATEHNLGRRPRTETPLSFSDCISDGLDMDMDDGEIQDAENRYERGLDRWFE
ncbi:hypothetical protein LRP67_16415 [Nocardioides sp. cx-169]|uniref:hypothetical protein n=1 Tax=Nocardioides sp. cx-169 TaxID=2899080 RepID=UPI001E4BBDDC|nr:hypothetical protein [Nocardioides sp. cx-169]MCD4535678.1 hypothetical protein [Nocardioides sp. cx-169]